MNDTTLRQGYLNATIARGHARPPGSINACSWADPVKSRSASVTRSAWQVARAPGAVGPGVVVRRLLERSRGIRGPSQRTERGDQLSDNYFT
jgi:hypothetical protein